MKFNTSGAMRFVHVFGSRTANRTMSNTGNKNSENKTRYSDSFLIYCIRNSYVLATIEASSMRLSNLKLCDPEIEKRGPIEMSIPKILLNFQIYLHFEPI